MVRTFCKCTLLISFYALSAGYFVQANTLNGRIELGLNTTNATQSYQDFGSGILRFDDTRLTLFQGLLVYQARPANGLTSTIVANAYEDGEQHIGFTQAFLEYKPLSPKQIRYKYRAGFFYPRYSVENTDIAWLSPYTYTMSAINTWVGEEMRIPGLEVSAFSNGRRIKSPWSWELNAGLFKANDPAGTLIAWRGFAYHDRQSLHHDRVNFAPIPSIVDGIVSPNWIEPFEEIDGRWGYYLGAHVNYQRNTMFKYYYYDNNADSSVFNALRIYAWDTKFHSLALSHNITPSLRLLSQIMIGSTDMGPQVVYADYSSAFVMLSYKSSAHRYSLRAEYSDVSEDDLVPEDQNNFSTRALTAAWRFQYNDKVEIGAELHFNRNSAENRVQLDQVITQNDKQFKWVLAYQF
jgi:hypothetical protein